MFRTIPFLAYLVVLRAQALNAQTVLHVDDSNTNGAPDGLTWAAAFPDLQQALAVANANTLIREIGAAGALMP